MSIQIIFVTCVAALRFIPAHAQSGKCALTIKEGGEMKGLHVCIGRSLLDICTEHNEVIPSARMMSCAQLTEFTEREDEVCYGGSWTIFEACGPPPPVCSESGHFPVQRRCINFYTCVPTSNSTFVQYISECEPGYEFNVRARKCSLTAVAGCSVPYPDPCIALSRLPDSTSCRHYFQCLLFGNRSRRTCPLNQLYDIPARACRAKTECGARPIRTVIRK